MRDDLTTDPESIFDAADPDASFDCEDAWQDALEELATELDGPAEPETPQPAIPRQSRLVFSVAGERYSAPLDRIVRLDRLGRLTPVPNTPTFVLGVTNVRGEFVPALDLRQLLRLMGEGRPADQRLVQLRSGSGGMVAGFVVDALHGIRAFSENEDGAPRFLDVDALFDSAPIQALMRGGKRAEAA